MRTVSSMGRICCCWRNTGWPRRRPIGGCKDPNRGFGEKCRAGGSIGGRRWRHGWARGAKRGGELADFTGFWGREFGIITACVTDGWVFGRSAVSESESHNFERSS